MTRSVPILALLLAACSGSGGPSEQNLREALHKAGNRGAAQAKLLACKRSEDRPGYVCDYRAPDCNRFTGTCGSDKAFTGRFLKSGGGWQQVENLSAKATPDPATQPLPGVAVTMPPAALPPASMPVATPTTAPLPQVTRTPAAPPQPPVEEPQLSRKDLRRISQWRDADAACRDGDDNACVDRDDLGDRLQDSGLCYGPPGAYGYDRAWRRCAD